MFAELVSDCESGLFVVADDLETKSCSSLILMK